MIKRSFLILVLLLFINIYCKGQGVSSSIDNAYVPAGAFISFFGNHSFSNGVIDSKVIYTNKGENPGSVNFVGNAKWSGANDNSYVDGFVKVHHDDFFTFPIGDMGFYKPLSITGGSGTSAAYYFEDVKMHQSIINTAELRSSSNKAFEISPSATEYWIIKGEKPTQLIMHWNGDSDLKSMVNSINELKLIGWNGKSWEAIEFEVMEYALNVDTSNKSTSSYKSDVNNGSLISETIVPNDYSIITFGSNNKSINVSSAIVDSQLLPKGNIDMTLFPNPINNLNNVKVDYRFDINEGEANLVIYDNLGKMIYKQKLKDNNGILKIPIDMPIDQVYNVGIITEKGSKKFGAVIVNSY